MPKFTVPEAENYVPQGVLNPGWYNVQCLNAKIENRGSDEDPRYKLEMEFIVLGGTEQKDGSAPEERKLFAFLALDHFETHKDQGQFAIGQLVGACESMNVKMKNGEFDPDDFIDKTCDVKVTNREWEGEVQANIQRFKPSAE